MPPTTDQGTVLSLVRRNAAEYGDVPAIVDGERLLTWAEYERQAAAIAVVLLDLGVVAGEVVGLQMANRAEHVLTDIGAMLAGATPTSYYNTLAPDQLAYVAADSACTVCIVDAEFLPAWLAIRDRLPALRTIVVVGPGPAPTGVLSFEVLTAAALGSLPDRIDEVRRTAAQVGPDDAATIVYTSGTTGPPKGTIVTHAGIRTVLDGVLARVAEDLDGLPEPGRRQVSYLPLAHLAERTITHYLGCALISTVTYVRDLRALADELPKIRPHVFLAVPRVWEKLLGAVTERAVSEPVRWRRNLIERAIAVARQVGAGRFGVAKVGWRTRLQHALFERLIYWRIRVAMGLDDLVVAVSGAAPIAPDVLVFFRGLGVTIVEAYGMTETSAVLTLNSLRAPRLGTVGPALAGVELRLADDGELLARGRIISPGYLNRPEATADTFVDGWLRTGDLGRFDAQGNLSIIGRKKELIINAAGKNISAANVEQAVSSASELVGSVYVHGDNRPYLVALITLDPDWQRWCAARGIAVGSPAEAAADAAVRAEIDRAVRAGNEHLSRVEQVKRWTLLDTLWDSGTGELTPTLKLKRAVVRDKYAHSLETLYDATADQVR
ncbi:AMP-binding protein [Kribbella sandramycini]|uniref:Acyl-CoA synthetase n=1 Tax=Kribbella sandramycini TaxID=60450 RepID=A0A7Y4KXB6_9ACTN|nr:AMP-dependent synthetase/ligase [Kribbella sandramycini]MBB6569795.1 long-chain acyl-CoA synthetase [Kribbella sandramycini]NOL40378.1 AMP-binding protein [Kribbella sandramycini]